MKKTRTRLCLALAVVVLSSLCLSCKSDGYMPKRKKSHCNTCPTFSLIPQNQTDEQTISGLV